MWFKYKETARENINNETSLWREYKYDLFSFLGFSAFSKLDIIYTTKGKI